MTSTATPSPTTTASVTADVEERLRAADQAADLHAFITRAGRSARDSAAALDADPEIAAASPVRGWTLAVKDNIHVAGMPNTAGTPALRSFVPDADAPLLEPLLAAGMIIVGKANMHELAFGVSSNNAEYGPVRSSIDPSRTAGGSSGGTAVAVATGAAAIGLGTDTGGSVRVPASFMGICGFRPSTGLYSSAGVTPLSTSRDTVGIMARSMGEIAAVHAVARNGEPAPIKTGPIRLGLPVGTLLEDLAPEVEAAWAEAVDRLSGARIEWVPVDLSAIVELDARSGMPVVFAEMIGELTDYLADYRTGVALDDLIAAISGPDVAATLRADHFGGGKAARIAGLATAHADRESIRAAYASLFETTGIDAIAFPTTPLCAPLLDDEDAQIEHNGVMRPTFPTVIRNTAPGSFAGVPGITMPLPVASGALPVGFALDGPVGGDDTLLALSRRIEAILR